MESDLGESAAGSERSLGRAIRNDLCRYLDWDSRFFGFSIAEMNQGPLNQDTFDQASAWCRSQRIRCLYFTADANDAATVEFAEKNGFHLVDVRLTLTGHIKSNGIVPPRIRPWRESDLPALAAIARVSHRDTRFYFDRGFSNDRCDDLYETWIRNSCAGFADAVLVADTGQVSGYICCHLDPTGEGRLTLQAVAAPFRGQRLGSDLVHAALNWFASKGISRAVMSTTARNIASQRLYQRCGFQTASTKLIYHRWFQPAGNQGEDAQS
jgi:dTDP-4-amino-4,6-dideoxy-D-galactose acyltransferase